MSPALSTRQPRGLVGDTLRLMAAAAVIGATLGLAPVGFGFGQVQAADSTHLRVGANAFGSTKAINMDLNKSMIIDLPVDATEVIVSQPGVANAILRSKRRVVLQAVGSGATNIFFSDSAGRTIIVLDVSVRGASSNIAAALRDTYVKILPGANIDVQSVALVDGDGVNINRIVLSGTVESAEDADKALSIAGQFAGSADNVASVITVGGPQQVMLKVTVAEVQRDVTKQLGINLSGSFSVGPVSGNFDNGVDLAAPGGGTANMPFGNNSIDVNIRALEARGAVRTLAEPVLTAISGQPAHFRVGGDIPYRTVVDGNVVTEFKPYGIQLDFTPTIKSDGTVGLVILSEVSEPATDGALSSREVSTTVELGVGQTLSIAGLLSERARQEIKRLPGLGDIPILGALFRSREFVNSRTELVFLVTPYYAKPRHGAPELPTDRMQFANDAEAIFLGHIETMYGVGPSGTRGSYDGSVGFLLD